MALFRIKKIIVAGGRIERPSQGYALPLQFSLLKKVYAFLICGLDYTIFILKNKFKD